jgi:glycosyltransferase involved in cell wall biosynthesis
VRLAWFSPLPPMASGIADYTSEIVPYFRGRADVDVFCPKPGLLKRPKAPVGTRVLEPTSYFESPQDYDACFYHLGNNPFHEFVYLAARHRPEIAVFHDAALHHLIAHMTIEAGGTPGRYEGVLHGEYGPKGTRLAVMRRSGLSTDFEKFLFPLTAHVAQQAKGIVVHSEDAARRLREVAPDVPLAVIPHHAGEPPPKVEGIDKAEARRRLGLPQDAFVVGHFGFITKPKQPAAVVGGFARLHKEFPDSVLLMVGADHTGGALMRLVDQLGIRDAVRMAGYVDLEQFYVHLRAVDATINLRYPTAGETSGTMARSLAEGRVVIVNNYASWAELPGDVVLKVEIDGPQTEQVAEHLVRLARDPALRHAMEERARRYAAERLDPFRCVEQYVTFAREVGHRIPEKAPTLRETRWPVSFAATKAAHLRVVDRMDQIVAETLPDLGNAAFIDLLYRALLRRQAEDDAIRSGNAALTDGRLTRSGLAQRITESREFVEVRQLEDLMRDLELTPREFTLTEEDPPFAPETTERMIEVPWMLSRYRGEQRALDVGYAFASDLYLSSLLALGIPSLHGVDRAAAPIPAMARAHGDVRSLPYRDGVFDVVFCISTIEHVGRDNATYGFGNEPLDPGADVRALSEMARVLAPNGRLLISVPLGRQEDHGWFLQYDYAGWRTLAESSSLALEEEQAFRLGPAGWERVADPRSTSLLAYGDGAPAAKGVLCAMLVKRDPF